MWYNDCGQNVEFFKKNKFIKVLVQVKFDGL